MCGDSIQIPIHTNHVHIEKVDMTDEKEAVDAKIANHDAQASRISIMYKQRHAYQMLFENDEIETRKRLKNNKLMLNRIQVMSRTSEELFGYLKKMIDLEIKHEETIHKKYE